MKKVLFVTILGGVFLLSLSIAHATVVYYSNFETGVPSDFSGAGSLAPTGGYLTYGFDAYFLRNNSNPAAQTVLCLDGLPTHTSIELNFLLAIIDSWDGSTNLGGTGDPDYFNVTVDGSSIFSETFDNFNYSDQTYVPPAGGLLSGPSPTKFAYNAGWPDAAYDMGLDPDFDNIAHEGSSLTIAWFASGSGWQGGWDESWAIDNVEVILKGTTPVPEPATMLLLASGLAGLAAFRRRFKR
jgi:hypothetical protein